jgi:trimeric autotransporter adhesin
VPPQVLAQYASVNAAAEQTAQTPFQQYSGAFVAPVNEEQLQGITATNAAANEAQPYYGAATGVLGATQGATTPVNTAAEIGTAESAAPLTGSQIDQYLSPYLGTVLGSTEAIQNQENQQQQAGQLGNAITSGAFGSDRTGIAAANLEQQQNLANANIISGIANTGYQSALSTAQGEQQIGLTGAGQLATIGQTAYGEGASTASELGSLGTGAESAGLAGAQAQIAAGTVQQQTQQAQDTALYNQFLQQQSYPFQVDEFLANLAEGTGSLSGSTTTTTQPGGFFSDKRLKRDIKKIGETFDGQDVVTYKMGDDDRTHIGLIAQDVEKKHPHAVGVAGGFKVVDYGKATQEAANKGHFYAGGVVPFRRVHRDMGGGLAGVLQAQQEMYSAMPGSGQTRQINTGTGGGNHQLAVAQAPASPPPSGASELGQTMGLANDANKLYQGFTAPSGVAGASTTSDPVVQGAFNGYNAGLGYETGASAAAAPVAAPAAATAAPTAAATAAPAAASAAPAAASGAAAAAAPAAAEAAGTAAAGAAGTAAVGAGTAAAADAAAALAAEYAAADIGVAAMMAKRGGAVRRGYDSGGMPYSGAAGLAGPYAMDAGSMNIPDEPNTNTLKAAPAAAKQPTGLQTLLYMGDPNNTSQLSGEMFSNTAFASGGVAGRRGFDGGGGAADDDDQAVPDDAAPAPAQAPAGLGTQAPDATSGGGLAGWWGRNKGIVIPVLEGIGAGMTAPTSHPGVAIAAGLEAAARGYAPTQEQLATAAQTQQLAEQTRLQNIPLGVKARIAQTIPIPGVAGPSSAPPSGGGVVPPQTVNPAPATIAGAPVAPAATTTPMPTGAAQPRAPIATGAGQQPSTSAAQTAAGLAAQYRAQFFVNPARTPEEQAQKDAAIQRDWAIGGTMYEQQADNDYQARVQRAQQANRNAAQQLADTQYAQATNPAATAAARAAALARYNALRQWTGDGTELVGGVVRNTRTNQPEIGTIAQQGLTAEQAANLQIAEGQPVDTGAPARVPYSQWAAQHGIPLPSPTVGTGAAPRPIVTSTPPPAAPPQGGVARSTTSPAGSTSTGGIDFSSAPRAPAWVSNPTVVPPAGQDPKAYAAIQNELIAESAGVQQTQQDVINTNRMLHELSNSKTGPGMAAMSEIQTTLGNMTGSQFVSMLGSNPAAYAMLQKGLGQQALNDRIQEQRTAGASVRMGAQTDNLILNYLSASPEMPKAAAEGILKWKLQQDQWELGRQNAIPAYLKQGYDARYFNNVYPNVRPMAGVLTTTPPPGTTVPRGPTAVTSQAQYDALPKGAPYLWNGRTLVKQ